MKMEQKELTLEEMHQECVVVAFEIAKLRSMAEKHQKRFNDLSYKIWKKQQENDQGTTPEDNQ